MFLQTRGKVLHWQMTSKVLIKKRENNLQILKQVQSSTLTSSRPNRGNGELSHVQSKYRFYLQNSYMYTCFQFVTCRNNLSFLSNERVDYYFNRTLTFLLHFTQRLPVERMIYTYRTNSSFFPFLSTGLFISVSLCFRSVERT